MMVKINRGEVWIIDLNPTKGREQTKKRPCLVISSNNMNQSLAQLVIAIPITSKKRDLPFHIEVHPSEGGVTVTSYIMCEQIRSLSIDRMSYCIGRVNSSTLSKIENVLKILLSFDT